MGSKLRSGSSPFFEVLWLVAALILIGFAFLHPLSQATWHRLFWSAWGGGVAVSFVIFARGGRLGREEAGSGPNIIPAVGRLCFRSLVRGFSLGASVFALLALGNGLLASGEIEESQGQLVAKHRHSGKSGSASSYSLDVRHRRTGEVFRIPVPAIDYELSEVGSQRRLRTREGAFGWLYRVR